MQSIKNYALDKVWNAMFDELKTTHDAELAHCSENNFYSFYLEC